MSRPEPVSRAAVPYGQGSRQQISSNELLPIILRDQRLRADGQRFDYYLKLRNGSSSRDRERGFVVRNSFLVAQVRRDENNGLGLAPKLPSQCNRQFFAR